MPVYSSKRIVREGIIGLAAASMISGLPGVPLSMHLEMLIATPILLVLIPPIADMAGDFGCIFGSRLTTAMQLGLIEPSLKTVIRPSKILVSNVVAILTVASFASIYNGTITYLLCRALGLGNASYIKVVAMTLLTGVLLAVFIIITSIITAFVSYKLGLDPDNITAPIATGVGDLVGIGCLLLIAKLLGF